MAETQDYDTNYPKAFFALGLTLGNFIPYTVLMVFSTQLYKQLVFNDLGFYILAVSSLASALMCLLAPGIILSIGSKRSIIISSFGIILGLWYHTDTDKLVTFLQLIYHYYHRASYKGLHCTINWYASVNYLQNSRYSPSSL